MERPSGQAYGPFAPVANMQVVRHAQSIGTCLVAPDDPKDLYGLTRSDANLAGTTA